jgi:hypothetical protein
VSVTAGPFGGTKRFKVVREIGSGGMGVVYEALDRDRGVRVALKTLRALSGDAVFRFKNEFRLLQGLDHPNLVALGELIQDEGLWFFTMELLEGRDIVEYVAGDLARIRSAFGQLALGLAALHAAGRVHRDVKPSNILVGVDGRVVLLDFGLVAELSADSRTSEPQVVGTAMYMSPEQAASKPVGPESDWYSMGVVLYEALAGKLPFEGPALEVMLNKQQHEPPAPSTIAPAIPPDIDALCMELLRFDPAARPHGRQVLERLGMQAPTPRVSSSFSQSAPFVGRGAELGVLREAFDQSQKRSTISVLVDGDSGVGKSALVSHFLRNLAQEKRDLLILSGRCYERESVPYKGFDGVVDAVSSHLGRLAAADAAVLLPPQARVLARAFPVLLRVAVFAQAARRDEAGVPDPQERRVRVFAALRELLRRLAERHPLVITIDDIQWADPDSIALLAELMRPPESPPLLFIATVRPGSAAGGFDVSTLPLGEVRNVHLDPLPFDDSLELARRIIDRVEAGTADAAAIAREANGHPLVIDELVRHAALSPRAARPGFEEALTARIDQLDAEARKLLELIVVSGTPLAQDAAARATALPPVEFAKRVSLLRVANLVRTTGPRGGDRIEPFHDRIRSVVLTRLGAQDRLTLHERLAHALESAEHVDAEALAIHWGEAGDRKRAAHYAALAAGEAEVALAFDRAARLYRLAIDFEPPRSEAIRALVLRLAQALANAGRGRDAAEAFQRAITGANAAERLELQRQVAEQLLRSGHIDDGLEAVRTVLSSIDMNLPTTPRRALASLLLQRARIRLRGLRFERKDPSLISARELTRVDVCWSVAIGLSMFDTIRGADFQARQLLLALGAGEPSRVARALAAEAGHAATAGGRARKRSARLMAEAHRLAEAIDDPNTHAVLALTRGITAFLVGEWSACHDLCDEAEQFIRNRCTGMSWELSNAQLFAVWSLAFLGEMHQLARRVPQLLQEAEERGDLYAATSQRTGLANLAWLAADRIDVARARVREADEQWSKRGFHFQHYWNLLAECNIDLYAGDGQRAYERVMSRWDELAGSLYLRIQNVRVEALHLRARCALAAGKRSEAERIASRIARERMPWATALARLLRGDDLERAEREFEAVDMHLCAAACRRRRGQLTCDDELVAAADAWMHKKWIRNPARMTDLYAPGF